MLSWTTFFQGFSFISLLYYSKTVLLLSIQMSFRCIFFCIFYGKYWQELGFNLHLASVKQSWWANTKSFQFFSEQTTSMFITFSLIISQNYSHIEDIFSCMLGIYAGHQLKSMFWLLLLVPSLQLTCRGTHAIVENPDEHFCISAAFQDPLRFLAQPFFFL